MNTYKTKYNTNYPKSQLIEFLKELKEIEIDEFIFKIEREFTKANLTELEGIDLKTGEVRRKTYQKLEFSKKYRFLKYLDLRREFKFIESAFSDYYSFFLTFTIRKQMLLFKNNKINFEKELTKILNPVARKLKRSKESKNRLTYIKVFPDIGEGINLHFHCVLLIQKFPFDSKEVKDTLTYWIAKAIKSWSYGISEYSLITK